MPFSCRQPQARRKGTMYYLACTSSSFQPFCRLSVLTIALLALLLVVPLQPADAISRRAATCEDTGNWWNTPHVNDYSSLTFDGAVSNDYVVVIVQATMTIYARDCKNTILVAEKPLEGEGGKSMASPLRDARPCSLG